MATRKVRPARLDADKTAKPLTRIVGHSKEGDCIGPGTVKPEALEDIASGARIPLAPPAKPRRKMHDIQGFGALGARYITYVRELERLATECEEHLDLLAQIRDNPTADHSLVFRYVMDQIQVRLDAIHTISQQVTR